MTQNDDYKKRAGQVRSVARSHLRELRKQRLRRRTDLAAIKSVDEPMGAAITLPEDSCISEMGGAAGSLQLSDASPLITATEPDVLSGQDHMARDDDSAELNELSVENVAVSEMAEDVSAVVQPLDADVVLLAATAQAPTAQLPDIEVVEQIVEDDVPAPCANSVADTSADDLANLPGAGPGLIWMLNQCGISSLKDMATADPEKLSNEMGVVGQILDVARWVAFAQKR